MLLLASSVCGLFKWRQFEPEVILLAVGWYLRFSLSYREVEELLAERGLLVDHVTVWRWVQRYVPEIQRRLQRGSDRPTTVGGWMRPTSGLRASGCIYTGLSTPPVRRSTSFCRLNATQQRLSAFSPRPWAERTIRRRGSSTPTSTPVIHRHRAAQSRGGSGGELPASTGAVSQQCPGTGSSGDQAPRPRESAFSLLLGSLAYDLRL